KPRAIRENAAGPDDTRGAPAFIVGQRRLWDDSAQNHPDYLMTSSEEKWPHAWGFKDTEFVVDENRDVRLTGNRYEICGFKMPGFISFVEDSLGVKVDTKNLRPTVPLKATPPNQNPAFCKAVDREFEQHEYSFDDSVRAVHSHGQATADEVHAILYEGKLARLVDMVFFCTSDKAAER